ncbi:ATP-grasp domain-containing protein [Mesorhizobium loti]|uniref:Uncharacterized protein n=1 Tax=Rhizobium loti TaxID=381 RepID=M5AML9_RHILI|nr:MULTISPECIES: acetyl-CoA carboxylase biotin carboxylase subunit family protein [Mesorhizobium]ANN60855.1 hypothetical protein A9174_31935 [Mesorhizobium loti NZP2037]OBP75114.1 hypothetical protein BAE41_31330 [Mesorhizobium loti]OBP92701.1 hypothetical protein BAE38_31330 [Mesorhizobium loti]OBQ66481.1 hypothetical protein A9K72_34785 [Mesorhizobium loti]QKC66441.1 ATP-grasp domain-containing protein [Mesorhizobium jarvisii]
MATRALILLEGDSTGNGLRYVQATRRLGLHPIILSANPDRHDYIAAENIEVITVDTKNLEALIRKCSHIQTTSKIAGVTSSLEEFYATVGKLCRHFDLPGPNAASIERCCDKFTQRQLLAEAGVQVPAYRVAADAGEVRSSAAEIGLPVVLKPSVGSGSIGVRLCRHVDELAEHTTYLLGGEHMWRSLPRILVEEFAQGPYYCAHIMEDKVVGISSADFGPSPHFVARGLTFPALLTDDEHDRIAEVSLNCLQALGLGWGPSNIAFRWTMRGPVVIEVNPRLAGSPDPQLVQLGSGIDLVTEHIKLATGTEWELRRTHSQTAAARFLIPDRDGTLDWINGDSRATAVRGVAEVKLYVEPKAPIIRRGDFRDWIGHVVAVSPSLAQTEAILQSAVGRIAWSITQFSTLGAQE